MSDVHVTPTGQDDHELTRTCWCGPASDYEHPLNGARVIVHRRTHDSPRDDDPGRIESEPAISGGWPLPRKP